MFLLKFIYFLTFICCLNAQCAENTYDGVNGRWPVPHRGLKNSCGQNIKITVLTDPIRVSQDPYWDEHSGSILYVNEESPAPGVHRYVIDSREHYHVELESQGCGRVNIVLPIKDAPGKYFFACTDNLSILTWDGKSRTASFRNVTKPDPENRWPNYRVKNGIVAPSGALLFFTDLNKFPTTVTNSTLFAIVNGKVKKLAKGFAYGTGLGFSRDGTALYFTDVTKKHLYKARYNRRTDSIENVKVLSDFSKIPALQYPDSLTVDSEDYLWVVCYMAGLVIKMDPYSGEVICSIEFPIKELTSVALGRCPHIKSSPPNCLYVTSLRNETVPNGPYGGSMFLVEGIHSVGVSPYPLRLNTIVGNRRQEFDEQ